MNERKLFQSITKKEKIKNEKVQVNFEKNYKTFKFKSTKGITLIALVISIIVMLILAGVSLNATIGDNGIITQAQNATYMQSIAALEEYMQTEYVKYYDETNEFPNKVELLSNKNSNLFLKDGSKNYITYNGKIYYLVNKSVLPDDVKKQLKGGDTNEYAKYIRLQDVYGITSDLKVYYCKSGSENIMGNAEDLQIDPETPLNKINNNAELKSAISSALAEIGITVGEKGVTVGNVTNLKSLTLDGTKSHITNLNGISELIVLQELILKNLTIPNLDGIESCNMLKQVYFINSKLTDSNGYDKLGTVLDLQKLFLKFDRNFSEADSNGQIEKLSLGLSNATNLKKLEYFGIFGTEELINTRNEFSYNGTNGKYSYSSNVENNVTDISSLDKVAKNIKSSIKVIYMNNNRISNIEGLKNFSSIEELDIMNNRSLINLTGLENHSTIKYLIAQNTAIENIDGLTGCNNIESAIFNTSNIKSLNGLASEKLNVLDIKNSKIMDIESLTQSKNLTYLQLENNKDLSKIDSIKVCSKINNLYLGGNTALDETVLSSVEFQNIIKQCGVNYSLDGKYGLLFLNQEKVDLTNSNLTDGDLELLRGKTNIKGIKLTGNPNLSNTKIEEILATLTKLECVNLYNVSQVTNIEFVNKLTNLVELDLRGTNVVDLSVLENLANSNKLTIGCLILDKGDVATFQKTISVVSENYTSSQYSFNGDVQKPAGFIYNNKDGLKNFAKCTDITKFRAYNVVYSNVTGVFLDLSNCKDLTNVATRGYDVKLKLPKTLQYYGCENPNTPDLSDNTSLLEFGSSYSGANIDIDQVLENLKYNNVLTSFVVGRGSGNEIINNLHYLKNKSLNAINFDELYSLKKINIQEEVNNITYLSLYNCSNYEDISTFGNLTNLQVLNLYKTKVSSLDGISQNVFLQELNISDTLVNSLEPLTNITTMQNLECSNAKLSNLKGIENMNNMTDLNVSNNSISNLYYLSKLLEKGNIKLNNLNLANNLLENNSNISIDGATLNINNIEIIENLYKAGLRNIDISGNNFSDTSKIKSLKWNSYKE